MRLLKYEITNISKQLKIGEGVSNMVSEIIMTLITLSISVLLLNTFMSVDALSTRILNDAQEGEPIVELIMANYDEKYIVLYNARGTLNILDIVPVKDYTIYVFDKDSGKWYESNKIVEEKIFLVKINGATAMPHRVILITTKGPIIVDLNRNR